MLHLRSRGTPWLPEPLRRALTFWRRSIQARVVVSTVLLSVAVIGIVGWYLLHQIQDGLLDHRMDAVVGEANDETAEARERLEAAPGTDADVASQQRDLVEPIIQRGETRGFSVVLAGPTGPGGRIADGGANFTPGLDTSSVPTSLEEHFDGKAATASTYTTIRSTDAQGVTTASPGIVVGSQVLLPADARHLHPLLPLPARRAGGDHGPGDPGAADRRRVLLVVLVAAMTWLVTRQVVTPVRMARRVAERLAAGQLQERLRVSGEDDLARLATSFNQMATNLQRQIRQLEELSRVQRRFVSDVSHELRTPLTTVRMAGDVLHDARGDFDPTTARAAELLQTELDRFETLLVDLLEISRFDAGAAVLELDDVNLVDVAHRVVEATRAAGRAAQRRGRRAGARAIRAWPRPTCAGSNGSCATWSPTRSTTPAPTAPAETSSSSWRATTTRPRSPCATTGSAWRRASPRWCSTGSGAPTRRGPAPAAAPAWACRSRSRTPICTAAGSRPGVDRARARSSG